MARVAVSSKRARCETWSRVSQPGALSGQVPLRVRQADEDPLERVVLRGQVGPDLLEQRHSRDLPPWTHRRVPMSRGPLAGRSYRARAFR